MTMGAPGISAHQKPGATNPVAHQAGRRAKRRLCVAARET
jgi:hypothetical protein